MKNKKKTNLNLGKIQISKLQTSMITGGRALIMCTNDYGATCTDCETNYRSCTDHVKQ